MNYTAKQEGIVNKRRIGNQYEEMAKTYLLNQGYQILSQNFRSRFGEIDIIAREHEYIVFIKYFHVILEYQ